MNISPGDFYVQPKLTTSALVYYPEESGPREAVWMCLTSADLPVCLSWALLVSFAKYCPFPWPDHISLALLCPAWCCRCARLYPSSRGLSQDSNSWHKLYHQCSLWKEKQVQFKRKEILNQLTFSVSTKMRNLPNRMGKNHLTTVIILLSWICIWRGHNTSKDSTRRILLTLCYPAGEHSFNTLHVRMSPGCDALS